MEKEPSLEKTKINKKINKRKDYDAYAYDSIKMNIEVENTVLQWFQDRNIDTTEKTILDMDCNTGNIDARLAETAKYVHGISKSKNFINFALNKHNSAIQDGKLSFEYVKTKNFESDSQKYDIAITCSMNTWKTNTEHILHTINKGLKPNGDFFAVLLTSDNPEIYSYVAAQKFIKKYVCSYLNLAKLTGWSPLSKEALITLFTTTGFEIVTLEDQSCKRTMTKEDIRESAKYVGRNTPLTKYIPDKKLESGLNKYADLCIEELQCVDKDKDEYTFEALLTVVHARKIKETDNKK
jgi:2-polyprenyl-3-methyl-5-hydroxy-6-metoxy-1,4-benzoquinol methylase